MDNETKNKVKIGAAVVIFLIIAWQVFAMFSGSAVEEPPKMKPNPEIPKPGELMPKPPAKAQQSASATEAIDAKFLAMQQEAQIRYMTALNELQMLKINKDIAETTKAIMKAKEDTITSQVKIVNSLKPPAPPTPVVSVDQTKTTTPVAVAPPPSLIDDKDNNLNIITVTNIRGRWTAVVSDGKSLYKVSVGDVVPNNDSNVIAIDRSGVTVERDGKRRKFYMVPVI